MVIYTNDSSFIQCSLFCVIHRCAMKGLPVWKQAHPKESFLDRQNKDKCIVKSHYDLFYQIGTYGMPRHRNTTRVVNMLTARRRHVERLMGNYRQIPGFANLNVRSIFWHGSAKCIQDKYEVNGGLCTTFSDNFPDIGKRYEHTGTGNSARLPHDSPSGIVFFLLLSTSMIISSNFGADDNAACVMQDYAMWWNNDMAPVVK